jgi:hypothetical protein
LILAAGHRRVERIFDSSRMLSLAQNRSADLTGPLFKQERTRFHASKKAVTENPFSEFDLQQAIDLH